MPFHLPGCSTVNLLCAVLIERKETLLHTRLLHEVSFLTTLLKVVTEMITCGLQINVVSLSQGFFVWLFLRH